MINLTLNYSSKCFLIAFQSSNTNNLNITHKLLKFSWKTSWFFWIQNASELCFPCRQTESIGMLSFPSSELCCPCRHTGSFWKLCFPSNRPRYLLCLLGAKTEEFGFNWGGALCGCVVLFLLISNLADVSLEEGYFPDWALFVLPCLYSSPFDGRRY